MAAVPWARHGCRFTGSFEDQIAWLAANTSKTAVAELMRVAWRSVGQILKRVANEQRAKVDLLDGCGGYPSPDAPIRRPGRALVNGM